MGKIGKRERECFSRCLGIYFGEKCDDGVMVITGVIFEKK
jgi:hypothetical protein